MSKFNQKTPGTKTTNLAGGEAYKQSGPLALISLLITSFAQDQFYRSAAQTFETLVALLRTVTPLFAAQALVYARKVFGMRSITHVGASELAALISGQSWARDFYDAIIQRPDDMTEILSYHFSKGYKVTNAMKKGFAKAFERFDAYQLAKYRGEGKNVKLVDVVNMVHPRGGRANTMALRELVTGVLKNADTWEAKLSAAGQTVHNDAELKVMKADAWKQLITTRKIGYLALLRNLRNISQQAPEVISDACLMLVDETLIRKAKIFPFQYNTAYDELVKEGGKEARVLLAAVAKAFELAMCNVPKFPGDTLVALDVSGSMTHGDAKPAKIGAQFAAAIAKANNADMMTFDTSARFVQYNPSDSLGTIAKSFPFTGGGTDFVPIFRTATRGYDRIIILSDMQAWAGQVPGSMFRAYKDHTKSDPKIYSFDLAGYGSMQFPERNVYALAGFSEKIFDIMALLEADPSALVNTVKKVTF